MLSNDNLKINGPHKLIFWNFKKTLMNELVFYCWLINRWKPLFQKRKEKRVEGDCENHCVIFIDESIHILLIKCYKAFWCMYIRGISCSLYQVISLWKENNINSNICSHLLSIWLTLWSSNLYLFSYFISKHEVIFLFA